MTDGHERFTVAKRERIGEDTAIFTFDRGITYGNHPVTTAGAGEYMMVWIPGVSENPISIMGDKPLKMAVKKVPPKKTKDERPFSHEMFNLQEGDPVLARGPYGNGFDHFTIYWHEWGEKPVYLVAGGIGAAPLSFWSRQLRDVRQIDRRRRGRRTDEPVRQTLILGVAEESEYAWAERFEAGKTLMEKAKVFDPDMIDKAEPEEGSFFFICGPEPMMVVAAERTSQYTDNDKIVVDMERYMKCGVGACGGCATELGNGEEYCICVDGPAFRYSDIKGGDFGRRHRLKSGLKVDFPKPDL